VFHDIQNAVAVRMPRMDTTIAKGLEGFSNRIAQADAPVGVTAMAKRDGPREEQHPSHA
jgi:hypothetical protein